MVDVFTTTGSVDYDTAAYELLLRFALRPELYFDAWCDVKPTNETHKGASVTFFTNSDLAVATTPLTEDVDVSAVPMADTSVTVTLAEYGNATVTTARLRSTSMMNVDAAAANVIGFNAGISIDTIARNAFVTAGTVRYALGSGSQPTSRVTVAPANTLRATDFRRAYADLTKANVMTYDGYYLAFLHPDVAFDIKSETGELGWRLPNNYGFGDTGADSGLRNGEIGIFEGFRTVVSPRAPFFVDGGTSTTTDVYRTLFMGREAMAKAHSMGEDYGADPIVVEGPITDKLRRFRPIGWKHFVGYAGFRTEAMRAVESASSIGNNASG